MTEGGRGPEGSITSGSGGERTDPRWKKVRRGEPVEFDPEPTHDDLLREQKEEARQRLRGGKSLTRDGAVEKPRPVNLGKARRAARSAKIRQELDAYMARSAAIGEPPPDPMRRGPNEEITQPDPAGHYRHAGHITGRITPIRRPG